MKNKSVYFLILTCIFELLWVYGFNIATLWWHWAVITAIIALDFWFMTKACEKLPVGTVYAVFSAVGTAGVTIIDIFVFDAQFSIIKLFFIALLVTGVVSLKLADNKVARGD